MKREYKTCYKCGKLIFADSFKMSIRKGVFFFSHAYICPHTVEKKKKKRVEVVKSVFTLTSEQLQDYVNYYKQKNLKKYEVIVELHKKKETPANIVGVVQSAYNTSKDKTETYVKMVLYKIRKGIIK